MQQHQLPSFSANGDQYSQTFPCFVSAYFPYTVSYLLALIYDGLMESYDSTYTISLE